MPNPNVEFFRKGFEEFSSLASSAAGAFSARDDCEAAELSLLKAGLDSTRKLEDCRGAERPRSAYSRLSCVCEVVCAVHVVDHSPRPSAAPCCCAALRALPSAARKRASKRRGPMASASLGASAAAARKQARLSPNLLISRSAWPYMSLREYFHELLLKRGIKKVLEVGKVTKERECQIREK